MNEDKLLKDLGEYLKSKGWDVSVIGFNGISKRNLKYNHSLIIDFTGKRFAIKQNQEKVKEE